MKRSAHPTRLVHALGAPLQDLSFLVGAGSVMSTAADEDDRVQSWPCVD